ncbi:MAG: alpha-hydroxy-acid oxidizing protein [Rhizobiaceae bacterium]|nr:alpha-hydroxy-acid oxidizing protein [Rhizobiaceae bacterium]
MRVAALPDDRYPAISDLRRKAKKNIPFFAWEYLDSATGEEAAMHRNNDALGKITLVPNFMKGFLQPSVETELFGQKFSAPFGIPPIGYTSLMWPNAEQIFAQTAARHRIPHCLSTVASDTPENCGPLSGEYGWFQLYPPRQEKIRNDIIQRAKDSGYKVLVVTADVPWPSMRERQRRAGISIPPKITPAILWQIMRRPEWAYRTLKRGRPSFAVMEKYVDISSLGNIVQFVGEELGGCLDWEYFARVREQWEGPVVLKGILSVEDAKSAVKAGADAIWVSNHGGRQFEAAPAAIDVLPEIAAATGKDAKIIFDSGIRSGGDMVRAIRLGADFVFAGRPFMYGISALGEKGADHVYELFHHDLVNNMHQLGIETVEAMKSLELRRD